MTKAEYARYMASDHWRELRKEILSELNCCERCDLPRWLASIAYDQDLHLHHRHYRTLGTESWDDLEVLCARCHDLETHGRTEMRAPKPAHCEMCDCTHWDYREEMCSVCTAVFGTPYLWHIARRNIPGRSTETGAEYITRSIARALSVPEEPAWPKDDDENG